MENYDFIKKLKGGICQVKNVKAAGYKEGKYGVAIIFSPKSTSTGVYTSNKVTAAPLTHTKQILKDNKLSVIVANSGNANCFTGQQGLNDCQTIVDKTSQLLEINPNNIATASTGVIGRTMPMETILPLLEKTIKNLKQSNKASQDAAKAIMTTDTIHKEYALEVTLENGKKVKIGGMAKGSGMIAPNMATMLCFITTDAIIDKYHIDYVLQTAVKKSFNMLVIDGDESTNDMAILMANGKSNCNVIKYDGTVDKNFQIAIETLCIELAKKMAKDGEGATKFIQANIKSAKTEEDAIKASKSIISSSLVKSAIFGGDPNWGRIIAAIGYANINMDPENITISLSSKNNTATLVEKGEILAFEGTKQLKKAEKIVNEEEIYINVDLYKGEYDASAYGCDLTYDYVKINAEYTT